MNRRLVSLVLVLALALVPALVGCAKESTPAPTPGAEVTPAPLKIGTLATQDALPLWVAEGKGYFTAEGLAEVEIVTFQSAQECQAAFASGAVDALMTDIIVAAKLHASGTRVKIATIMLGADITQGRFAVMAAPDSGITSLAQLKGVPVGTAASTITEYILDELMAAADVAEADVAKEEVAKMPVRYQLLMAGQLKAAVLPEPFVSLAEQGGATIVPGGDDTKATENVSQSVLAVSRTYLESAEGAAALEAALKAWDSAIADINAAPDDFRQTLVDKAGLPAPLAATYAVSQYPMAGQPAPEDVQCILDWMTKRGYLSTEMTPADLLD